MQKAYVLLGVAATVLQLAATPQRRRELYVSPSGNPGGDGTLMKPFATIGGCIDYATRVATGAATGSPADAACVLSPGKYHEEVVVGPGPELRGPETSHVGSVSVIGAPGVELTGTASVPATLWRRCDGGTQPVYCAVLPPNLRPRGGEGALQQVFVQGTMTFEARWPNTNLTEVGAARSWATTTNSTAPVLDLNTSVQISDGMIWSDALAATGVDFTGALLTLQAGTRVWTWTRTVKAHAAGSPILRYDGALIPEKGGPSELENLFFLSGVLGALDSPNEWLYNPVTHTLRIWMPDGDPPAGRVAVKTHDLCVSNLAQSERKTLPVHVANLSFFGCTFALNDCDGCTVRDVTATYPSYSRTVPFRDVPIPGKPPNVTLVEGNDTVVERVALRFSNVAGLLMIGSRVMVNEVLLEDFDWLGSLDFPPLQIGFGRMVCPLHAIHFDPSTCGHMMRLSAPPPRRLRHPHGDRARVNRVTVRHAGGCGIVASQLSHEISFSDVSLATTVGLDQAGLHIDNLDAHTNTLCDQNNCSKTWHHNWVHDIRDKCARGDDGTVDLSFHHNVVFNCGGAPGTPALRVSGCGVMLKGDRHRYFANTVFSTAGQGDVVVDTRMGPPCSVAGGGCIRGNNHSQYFNSAQHRIGTKHGGDPVESTVAFWGGMILVPNASTLRLRDPARFDFRPAPGSPLVGAAVHPPPGVRGVPIRRVTGSGVKAASPISSEGGPALHVESEQRDAGAYQSTDPPGGSWIPGCTFNPRC